ncbi:MAG: response regulator transcription factor [Cyclobacteriaceae bacterium]|nr:response regulator transcription factor [Cyclobacteriaceae bacterium]
MKKRVLVCEDHALIIKGLELLFNDHPIFTLVGTTELGAELSSLIDQLHPDILLLDLNLKDRDGLILLEEIRKKDKWLKVIILTMYQDDFLIQKAKRLGANGYLEKNVSNEELLLALEYVNLYPFYLSKSLQKQAEDKQFFQDHYANKMKLTRRELELIQHFAKGKLSQQIADELFLSAHTVDTHRKNILRKLKLSSLVELVNFAHENKLV